jgi:hypothetical protein
MAAMETNDTVTAELFLAFLKCPTKAYFLAHGEPLPETYFSNVETEIASRYKLWAWQMLQDRNEPAKPLTFEQMIHGDNLATTTRWLECDTVVLDSALSRNGAAELCSRKSDVDVPIVPVVFTPKGTRDYATLLSIQQTLKYRGREFLEFMRSGEMEIPG